MATYALGEGENGVWEQTLAANTVDTVTFALKELGGVQFVTVVNATGASSIYFTVNGAAPTVGGRSTWWIPAVAGATRTVPGYGYPATVKLIAAASTTYSVEGSK